MVGFVFGLYLISAANDCNAADPEDQHGDCDMDFEVSDFARTFKYVFQVFIGMGDLSGVVAQGIAIFFMIAVIILG